MWKAATNALRAQTRAAPLGGSTLMDREPVSLFRDKSAERELL